MHLALAAPSENPDVHPVSFNQLYQQSLYQSLRAGVRQTVRSIRRLCIGPRGVEAASHRIFVCYGYAMSNGPMP